MQPAGATMMDGTQVQLLTAWCNRRALSWSPGRLVDGAPVMVLRPQQCGRPWQGMALIMGRPELRLEDEQGDTLASASDLPALLDALDGGVAEPPQPGRALAGSAAFLPGLIL